MDEPKAMPLRKIIVHAGLHKTGSTSIQHFLESHREKLRALGIDFFQGAYLPQNHMELHASAMRQGRMSPFKLTLKEPISDAFRERVRERVAAYIENSPCERILFSAEGLSYLRHPDEMERLRALLGDVPVEIILYLRSKDKYLASYLREMAHYSSGKTDAAGSLREMTEGDWLVDYKGRVRGFADAFGTANVVTIDYDRSFAEDGSVIPSLLRHLGIVEHFERSDWSGVFLNKRPRWPWLQARWNDVRRLLRPLRFLRRAVPSPIATGESAFPHRGR